MSGPRAIENHIHGHNEPLNTEIALRISSERNYTDDVQFRINTIFERPSGFQLYLTDDPENSWLIISRLPVKTFVCQCTKNNGRWDGQYIGMFHAIFTQDGYHFPGYLYENINF